MSARVVMLGMPGAGKGTQAARLATALAIPAISTGDIFRSNVANNTKLGEQVARYIARGNLVPDELTNALVADRLSQADAADGFLLDGFPRTIDQAKFLAAHLADNGTRLDAVVELIADPDEVTRRLLARAKIEGRADDTEPVIRQRLAVYDESTRPLTDFYAGRGQLVRIDGLGDIEEVTDRMLTALREHMAAQVTE